MGKEENEAREKARRDKNVKKWKQNTDRWAKWKAEQKEKKEVKEETDKDRYLGKSYKHSRDKIRKKQEISDAKAGLQMANLTSKAKLQNLRNVPVKEETKFTLPEKYGGDYSVRKIYMDEGAPDLRGGTGSPLYGSVANSPARQAPRQRPQVAARPQAAPMRSAPPTASAPAAGPTLAPKPNVSFASKPTGTAGFSAVSPPPPRPKQAPPTGPAFKEPEGGPGSGGLPPSTSDTFRMASPVGRTPTPPKPVAAAPTLSTSTQGTSPTAPPPSTSAEGGATAPDTTNAMQKLGRDKVQGLLKKIPQVQGLLGKLGGGLKF